MSLMLCCPLTTRIKGHPSEAIIAGDPPSVVLADQIRSLDWRMRKAKRKDVASPDVMAEVRGKLRALLD